ncbi:protein tyrosine phosphatase [Falsirhodobacter algicola]|uniref:Protein tyrosine phosphatase n=2 Tax=Falsirhodobacter algicola TaxID=2692330 RepID=A0A8J8MUY1_9RHOB|nr:protein tyrosine phosphatase [Falsirhodobacter algicola]
MYRKLLLFAALCLGLPGGYLAQLQLRGNFHPVLEGVAYRSAQPSGDDLDRWITETGIRSVINLRGEHTGTDWYDAEIAASARLNLVHYDFGMSAGKALSQDRAQQLLALLRAAPKPVLIHCKSGADRTGLASALLLAALSQDEEMAEAQISFRYGHISIPHTAAWPMDQSWEALEPWLGFSS